MTMPIAVPPGFRNLTPYLLVPDVDGMLAYYAEAFEARTVGRDQTPRGVHSAFRIGDTTLMMGGPVDRRTAMLHLYVDDLQATVQRALSAGGVLRHPVSTAPYGETFAVVADPATNAWIIADRATSTLRHSQTGAVTPYLNPSPAASLITFLEVGLGAEVLERHDHEPRGVSHCKMRIGESVLELGDPEERAAAFTMMFYLYVHDVEASYAQALNAGATSIQPPALQHYGDYVGAFTDPVGNQWYVARPDGRHGVT